MKLFKSVDEKLEKLGFVKVADEGETENFYGVSYRKEVNNYGYTHRVDIGHKASGRHIIQSYQEETNADGFNNTVGLTYEETKLIMKKYRQMKRKCKWQKLPQM